MRWKQERISVRFLRRALRQIEGLFTIFLRKILHKPFICRHNKDKMSGNLKTFLTISSSLCESYDGFDLRRRTGESGKILLAYKENTIITTNKIRSYLRAVYVFR